jgi:hypothetical protein
LYAVHAAPAVWVELGLGKPPDDRPLYVGKSESSLVARDLRQHFGDGRTGSSTLRRSFAALLSDRLDLHAIPRNPSKPAYFSNYGLSPADDARLTAWMRAKLRLATWPSDADTHLATIELQVIRHWKPPLNLQGVTTPWSALMSARRASMATQARAWRP